MSQRINHRRGEDRHQDNGPRYENGNPMAGCNSTHVARARRGWRAIRRRKERRRAQKEIAAGIAAMETHRKECPKQTTRPDG